LGTRVEEEEKKKEEGGVVGRRRENRGARAPVREERGTRRWPVGPTAEGDGDAVASPVLCYAPDRVRLSCGCAATAATPFDSFGCSAAWHACSSSLHLRTVDGPGILVSRDIRVGTAAPPG
jgi:hypothetical protein